MTKRILYGLVAVVLAGAGFYFRAQNAQTAQAKIAQISQQDAVAGDTAPLRAELKSFVASHMGISVKLTLHDSYARAQAAAQAATSVSATNSQIYTDAQHACAGKSDSVTQAKCNQDYLSKHLTNVAPATPVPEPKLADYQYNFQSPLWSPDLALSLIHI